MNRLKLRAIYALHMLAPAAFVLWHIEQTNQDTLTALRTLFS